MWANIALTVLVVVVVVSVLWTRNKVNIRVEPFESGSTPKDVASKVDVASKTLAGKVDVKTYRASYEETIMSLDDLADLTMVDMLNTADGTQKGMLKLAQDFNTIADFKRNLNTAMTFVDKN